VLLGCIDGLLSALEVQPSVIEEIKAGQKHDAKVEKFRDNLVL